MDEPSPDSRSTKNEHCPTHIIEDAPAQADTLAVNGSIGPMQESLTLSLIRNGEAGGRMIGIEGGWGSGKTSVS